MKTNFDFFRGGQNGILSVGEGFMGLFRCGSFEMPEEKIVWKTRVLEEGMFTIQIFMFWKPQVTTLGELAVALKDSTQLLKNGSVNLFLMRDGIFINADWQVGGWRLDAHSAMKGHFWFPGNQVVTRRFRK